MRGVKKALRQGIYTALVGISAPVYDGFANVSSADDTFVVLGSITEGSDNTLETFITQATIDINLCHKVYNTFKSDLVEDLEDEVLQVLIPTVDTPGFSVSGFQAVNAVKVGSSPLPEPGGEFNIARIVLRIQVSLIEH